MTVVVCHYQYVVILCLLFEPVLFLQAYWRFTPTERDGFDLYIYFFLTILGCYINALFVLILICNLCDISFSIRETLIKSARADGERFCFLRKFGKVRNTVCISTFPFCTEGAKDPLLSRRRLIQRFLSISSLRRPGSKPLHPSGRSCLPD